MSRSKLWNDKPHYSYDGRVFVSTSPRMVRVRDIERMQFCVDCPSRYSPVCKHCDLDGCCSRHGIGFEYDTEREGSVCPICHRSFDDDWSEYIQRYDTS